MKILEKMRIYLGYTLFEICGLKRINGTVQCDKKVKQKITGWIKISSLY